jgi:hypothetical protein
MISTTRVVVWCKLAYRYDAPPLLSLEREREEQMPVLLHLEDCDGNTWRRVE